MRTGDRVRHRTDISVGAFIADIGLSANVPWTPDNWHTCFPDEAGGAVQPVTDWSVLDAHKTCATRGPLFA